MKSISSRTSSSRASINRNNGNSRKRLHNEYNRSVQRPPRSSRSRMCCTPNQQGLKSREPGNYQGGDVICQKPTSQEGLEVKDLQNIHAKCCPCPKPTLNKEHQEVKDLPNIQVKCCTCQKPTSNKERQICVPKYVQPERPESFAPDRTYRKPVARMEDDTVYKMSYLGVDPEIAAGCRGEMKKAEDNIASAGKFSSDTTQRHDYRKWPGAVRAVIILPDKRKLLGEGPMSSLTTQKHDYPPKNAPKPEAFLPMNNLRLSNKKMEDTSTMNASYQPIHKCDPVHSYKPLQSYKEPSMPLESETVNKLSYVPWPTQEKEDLPWASRGKYSKPIMPMEGNTIYSNSYLPSCDDARRGPIKHLDSGDIIGDGRHFEDRTVYKESYLPVDDDIRPEPLRASDNLTTGTAKFADQTTQKHDYRGWPGAVPADIIMPDKRRLLGEGPMSSQTTQKHDYPPKNAPKPDPFLPANNLRLSNKRMEDISTMNASYQPIHKYDPAHSYKPQMYYKEPSMPLESETVNKLSYVPWPTQEKEDFPWASKGTYNKPVMPMDGNTIYNNSYLPTCEDARRDPIKQRDFGNILGDGRHFEERTVYKESYLPVGEGVRPEAIRASDNLTTGNAQFANQTTQRHDYRGWPGAVRADIILPDKRRLLGEGPMSSQTTQKHDYTPKNAPKPDPFLPMNNLRLSNKRMEDTSTMNASYQPIHKYDPAHSFKPVEYYKEASMPLESETVNKLSYVPWPTQEKEDLPWASKGTYKKPIMPMDGNTIYNNSYLSSCEYSRRDPIKHLDSGDIIGCGRHFEERTVYKESYLPVSDDIHPEPLRPSDNLTTGTAKFADQTTQKHDYRSWPGAVPAEIIMPDKRRLLGEGPMSSLTTQKHDYYPKNAPKPDPFLPANNLRLSNKRMEDTSTMNASYQPFHKYDPVHSYKPQQYYKPPSLPFEDNTVNKMSYVPWPTQEKEDLPWASKGQYKKPIMPFDAETIYKNSYIAPGKYECEDDRIPVGAGDGLRNECCTCCPC